MSTVPAGMPKSLTTGGMLAPGFVDLQVNGGGGVMLNDHPTVEGIETICRAHAPFGTTALLPTLITDTPEITAAAIAAGIEAARRKVPGFARAASRRAASLHRPQGRARPEADPADDGRRPGGADRRAARSCRRCSPPSRRNRSTPQQIAALAEAGIVVSLGHTDATYATARAYADAGATMATHLFNAMSQIGNREPGLVGAALDDRHVCLPD